LFIGRLRCVYRHPRAAVNGCTAAALAA
jgi:hypothetical protein